MNEFLAILVYTFKENARKKTFIISTLILIILSVAAVSVPGIMNSFKSKGEKKSAVSTKIQSRSTVYVIDEKRLFTDNLAQLNNIFTSYKFEQKSISELSKLKADIKNNESKSIVVLNAKDGVPFFNYYIKTYGKGLSPDDLSGTLKKLYIEKTLNSANVNKEIIKRINSTVNYNYTELGKGYVTGYIGSIVISMVLFFAIYFFAYGVSMSVASEKTSRVMELLVTSTKPSRIVLGKSTAMGLLGLCQLGALLLAVITTYKLTFPKDFLIGGQKLDFSGFTPFTIVMVVVYFILGYSLFAMMNAVAGATVSKAEDVNSAIMPISMISMVSFYFAYFSLMAPSGNVAMAASLIPFSAAFSMPCRIIAADVPVWQIVSSLAILIVSIALVAWLSIKIYSSAVLHYGKRLRLKDMLSRI